VKTHKMAATIAGAGLVFSAGCSGPKASHEASQAETTPNSVITLGPLQPGPKPFTQEQATYLAGVGARMESEFEQKVRTSTVTAKRIVNLCAVVAYQPSNSQEKVAVVTANPINLSARDKATGASLSITAVYNQTTQEFIFGPIRLAKETAGDPVTESLPSDTQEVDLFPPGLTQVPQDVNLHWSASKQRPVNADNKVVMGIESESLLTQTLHTYALSELSLFACEAGLGILPTAPPSNPSA